MVRRMSDGIRVCDLGCAEGVAVLLMAEAFPRSRFVGLDISREAIAAARAAAGRIGLQNVEFVVRDAATLAADDELAGAFDYVTAFDAIHDQSRPLEALRGVRHILAARGAFSMIDIAAASDVAANLAHPMGPFLYTVSLMHCMPVGLFDGGAGLGMMWGREAAVSLLREAGFDEVTVNEIPQDPFNLHFFCRKS
jgi:ubiquinone/menaquinone biosynthesis C-methylase UbiE